MQLGSIVLHLRDHQDIFALVGGAAEYAFAREATLRQEAAFVIPLQDTATDNDSDTVIQQKITEQFAIVVAIKNDTDFKDKTGFAAYNRLHDVRNALFSAVLGLDIGKFTQTDDEFTSESLVYYNGGQLLDMDRAYMWWQFTFAYKVSIQTQYTEQADGFLDKIFAQTELMDSDNIPFGEPELPAKLFAPDMEQLINLAQIREDS